MNTICLESKSTTDLAQTEIDQIWSLMRIAFGPSYDEQAWKNCLGGQHLILRCDGRISSHAAIVPRNLVFNGATLDCMYVESVATLPPLQGCHLGSATMSAASGLITLSGSIGALATSIPRFYERFGWQQWLGETLALTPAGFRMARPSGSVMVLPHRQMADLDVTGPIAINLREGDVW